MSVASADVSSFEHIVESSFSESVSTMLGQETWKAIRFYFDISLLANEPEIFASVLERLFGGSAKILEKMITETLFAKVGAGIEKKEGYSFQALVRIAKAKFLASVSGLRGVPSFKTVSRR